MHMFFKSKFLPHLLVPHQKVQILLADLMNDGLESVAKTNRLFRDILLHIIHLSLMFLAQISSTWRFNLQKFKVFESIQYKHDLMQRFVQYFQFFNLLKVQLIDFKKISMKKFFKDSQRFDKIALIQVKPTILFAFSKLRGQAKKAFIIL